MTATFRAPVRRWARPTDDEGVALMFVVMCMLVALGLVTAVIGLFASELVPTAYERKSQRTIAAAQAGLQAGLASVRSATGGVSGTSVVGDITKLPCYTALAPLVGTAGAAAAGQAPLGYQVSVQYFTVSPKGRSLTWRAANALPCTTGLGVSATPVYALVTATATSTATGVPTGWGDRSVELVYNFSQTDSATVGGPIHSSIYGTAGTANWCWEAASYPPSAGTRVRLAVCSKGRPAQAWAYRTDYSIVLAGTQTSTSPPSGGYCISTDVSGTTPVGASLQPCVAGQWNQLWGYNDSSEFAGVNTARSRMTNQCLTTNGSFSAGVQLTVGSCQFPDDNWTPDATAGAGAAGGRSQQLVNYAEYGRCVDLTNQNLNATFFIDYPCKQDPTSAVSFNQRWVWDGAGTTQIVSNTPNNGPYCLTSAGTAGGYVVARQCDTTGTRRDQQWTVLDNTGNRSTSYTVLDSFGRCLALGAAPTSPAYLANYSTIVTAACDGTFQQKWNAPPLDPQGSVTGERENTGGR